MRILGISAFYHDSAAAAVEDGRIVAAAQEERFTRKKHDSDFPNQAIEFCLREAGVGKFESCFLRVRKKFWLMPIFVMMFLFGGLVVLTQGSAVAPFIYTVF